MDSEKVGFVYILASQESMSKRIFKIGRTKNLKSRISAMNVGHRKKSQKLFLVHAWEVDDATDVEKTLHNRYAGKRTRGEFYKFDYDDFLNMLEFMAEKVRTGKECFAQYEKFEAYFKALASHTSMSKGTKFVRDEKNFFVPDLRKLISHEEMYSKFLKEIDDVLPIEERMKSTITFFWERFVNSVAVNQLDRYDRVALMPWK